jgi:hypothetical protein
MPRFVKVTRTRSRRKVVQYEYEGRWGPTEEAKEELPSSPRKIKRLGRLFFSPSHFQSHPHEFGVLLLDDYTVPVLVTHAFDEPHDAVEVLQYDMDERQPFEVLAKLKGQLTPQGRDFLQAHGLPTTVEALRKLAVVP